MELSKLKSLVSDGLIFSVTFIKRSDGRERKMLARMGVKKGVTGRGSSYDPESKNLLTVFDMQKQAFRTVPVENILELRVKKHHMKIQ